MQELLAQYRALEAEWSADDEMPDEINAKMRELGSTEVLQTRPIISDPAGLRGQASSSPSTARARS